tara:strand:+ start:1429 stop:1566 length:138 start_codon:yes stop_codon:yes gene_type:complete
MISLQYFSVNPNLIRKKKTWCSVKEVDEPDCSGADETQLMENIAF